MQVGQRRNAWNTETSVWTLQVAQSGVSVTVRDANGAIRAEPERLGVIEWDPATACVWMATLLQTALFSDSGVLWPVADGIALSPKVVGEEAMWVVSETSIVVTSIGTLDRAPADGSIHGRWG